MDFQGDEHHGDELDGDEQAPANREITQMDFHGEELHSDEQAPAKREINQMDFKATSSKRGRDSDEEQEPQDMTISSSQLEEPLKKWFREGGKPAYKYSEIQKHLALEVTHEALIEILNQLAVVVQGVWVPKSSILQLDPKESLTRDYLLMKFSQNETISYEELGFKKFETAVRLRAALRSLAIERPLLKDWQFKADRDVEFLENHPQTAVRHGIMLKSLEPFIMSYMNEEATKTNSFLKTYRSIFEKQTTTNSVPVPIEKREELLKALEILFKHHSVLCLGIIRQQLWNMAVSVSSIGRTADINWSVIAKSCLEAPDELNSVVGEFTTKIHSVHVAKSSLIHPGLSSLRNVVIELLVSQPANEKLMKGDILKAFKTRHDQDATNDNYLKIMNELCIPSGKGWVLKWGGVRAE